MIRGCLNKHDLYGKLLFRPKYGNSFYDSLEYTRVLSGAKPDPNDKYDVKNERWIPNDKYDVENERWMIDKEPTARGGSEVNVNNPKVRPNIS